MGKSTTAEMFAEHGCAVWDADAAVHRLYSKDGAAIAPLKKVFAASIEDGAVNRSVLKALISTHPDILKKIEAIVHPLVAADRDVFLASSEADIIVLDIPLLFENGMESQMDAVAVVSAPAHIQKARVLERKTMNEETFKTILSNQMPDLEKRKRADIVIPTETLDETREVVAGIIARIKSGGFDA